MSMTQMFQPKPAATPLARLCQALLAQEESHLQTCLVALKEFRQLLARNETEARALAVQKCKEASDLVSQVRDQRDQFCRAAASILEVAPSTVTLRLVADHLPSEEATGILLSRARLRELAKEVEQVNQGNALIIWWCLDFVHKVFAELQGQPIGCRYSAAGKAHAGVGGPLWQGQG